MQAFPIDPASFHLLVGKSTSYLSRELHIPLLHLDYSIDSLLEIHPVTLEHRREDGVDPRLFLPLVAYLGGCILRAKVGRWVFRQRATGVQEPWILTDDGKWIAPFMIVYQEVYECQEAGSMGGAVQGATF